MQYFDPGFGEDMRMRAHVLRGQSQQHRREEQQGTTAKSPWTSSVPGGTIASRDRGHGCDLQLTRRTRSSSEIARRTSAKGRSERRCCELGGAPLPTRTRVYPSSASHEVAEVGNIRLRLGEGLGVGVTIGGHVSSNNNDPPPQPSPTRAGSSHLAAVRRSAARDYPSPACGGGWRAKRAGWGFLASTPPPPLRGGPSPFRGGIGICDSPA